MQAYGRTILGYLTQLLRDRQTAEDVLQQVLLEVWERATSYEPERASLLTWVLMIAKSRAVDELRRRVPEPLDPSAAAERAALTRAADSDPERILEQWRIAALLEQLASRRGESAAAPLLRRSDPKRDRRANWDLGGDDQDQDGQRTRTTPRHARSRATSRDPAMKTHRDKQRRRAAERLLEELDKPATGASIPSRSDDPELASMRAITTLLSEVPAEAWQPISVPGRAGAVKAPPTASAHTIPSASRGSCPGLRGGRVRRRRLGQPRRQTERLNPSDASRHRHAAAVARPASRRRRPGRADLRRTNRDHLRATATSGHRALLRGLADDQRHEARIDGVLPTRRARARAVADEPARARRRVPLHRRVVTARGSWPCALRRLGLARARRATRAPARLNPTAAPVA